MRSNLLFPRAVKGNYLLQGVRAAEGLAPWAARNEMVPS
jgi:hypothetical protein